MKRYHNIPGHRRDHAEQADAKEAGKLSTADALKDGIALRIQGMHGIQFVFPSTVEYPEVRDRRALALKLHGAINVDMPHTDENGMFQLRVSGRTMHGVSVRDNDEAVKALMSARHTETGEPLQARMNDLRAISRETATRDLYQEFGRRCATR